MQILSDKVSDVWKRIKTLPTTVWRVSCDEGKGLYGNVNRW